MCSNGIEFIRKGFLKTTDDTHFERRIRARHNGAQSIAVFQRPSHGRLFTPPAVQPPSYVGPGTSNSHEVSAADAQA